EIEAVDAVDLLGEQRVLARRRVLYREKLAAVEMTAARLPEILVLLELGLLAGLEGFQPVSARADAGLPVDRPIILGRIDAEAEGRELEGNVGIAGFEPDDHGMIAIRIDRGDGIDDRLYR